MCLTVVLLHGFMGCATDWDEIVALFKDDVFCIMPDLPGHGNTPPSDDPTLYSIESTARSVIDLLDKFMINRTILAGYSMGGRIALYTALEYPNRCSGLILESASPGLKTEAERKQRMAADKYLVEKLRKGDMEKFIDDWYDMPLFESLKRYPDKLARLKRKRMTNNVDGLIHSFQGVGTGVQPSLWERLSELTIPVLLICGELDSKFVGINKEMSSMVENCALEVVEDAGHNTHFEHPARFYQATKNFIEEHISEFREM